MAKKRTSPQPLPTAAPAYLQNPLRIGAILGSFAVLVVPLAVLQLSPFRSDHPVHALSVMYAVLLGGTHFLITLALYFHEDNLRYFASSASNIAIYFVAPVAILALFFVIGTFQLNADHPNASAGFLLYIVLFSVIVKAFDYFPRRAPELRHSSAVQGPDAGGLSRVDAKSRQQLLLEHGGAAASDVRQWCPHGQLRFRPRPLSGLALAWAAISFCGVVAGFAIALGRTETPRSLLVPFGYFLLQGASATLPAVRTELYTASLAMHYVEYHIIIFPRLFSFDLDPASPADRVAAWTRRHKIIFYVVLAAPGVLSCPAISGPLCLPRWDRPRAPWLMFNLLSGIFVTHYFIEAFVWKFRNPYYRQSLAPLYFPRRDRQAAS